MDCSDLMRVCVRYIRRERIPFWDFDLPEPCERACSLLNVLRYTDGKVSSVSRIVKGWINRTESYYPDGQIECEFNFGARRTMDGRQFVQSEFNYGEGLILVGRQSEWYPNGKPKSLKYYNEDGNAEGHWEAWYENGDNWMDMYYVDGELDGRSEGWYTGKRRHYISYHDHGKPVGHLETWYENGEKACDGYYVDGVEDGCWTAWYENGAKWYERHYVKGKKDGHWIQWWKTGKKDFDHVYNAAAEVPVEVDWFESLLRGPL